MAYTTEEKEKLYEEIFRKIENGSSLRKALIEVKLPTITFYEWIDNDDAKAKQYARACEARTEFMADEILDIADSSEGDLYVDDFGDTKIDGNTVQRAKTQIEARKWLMSKMFPKKYGDKVDVTSGGDKISSAPTAITVSIVTPEDD